MADGSSFVGKLILTAVVIGLTPFTEILTGAAPIGVLGALGALVVIWFGDPSDLTEEL